MVVVTACVMPSDDSPDCCIAEEGRSRKTPAPSARLVANAGSIVLIGLFHLTFEIQELANRKIGLAVELVGLQGLNREMSGAGIGLKFSRRQWLSHSYRLGLVRRPGA
ncbi:hypothetical protein EN844_02380 [Mesorhizobium sp. M3A.F.Ca.ET.201.01.1.1]|uniref:hypothetical protein n=1 Tax=unclassified Mesorhizobium TaxID=325217 RepID=UPI000FE86C2B|nr:MULTISPECIES: hypothetical protein [unclassified Mesorhizobium]RWE31573.1 MAG: hypothetical protein EOS77_16615 [Mesorhizobium sp.]TGS71839.1 hypothetical protein EN844_02380 [Mesorhizobium sp. M3A.F.Ca.ET.201.01.1.1]